MRSAWADEAGDFTPWLAREENLALLGQTLGLELEFEAQEKNVGPFRADILCRDTATDNWVLVENQLGKTDHTHLGQLMTYAAGLKAVTIVWIAHTFADEHRAAMDWLNEVTADEVNFFGLEIELWRIGGSPPAPKFNVVSEPNEWSRSVDVTGELTERQQLYLDYWTAFRQCMLDSDTVVRPAKPQKENWLAFSVGRTNFFLYAIANVRDEFLAAYLSIMGPDRIAYFRLLAMQRDEIEGEMQLELDWREKPDRKESHVYFQKPGTDPTDRDDWPNQHKLLCDVVDRFYRVFSPRIKALDASEYEPEEEVSEE